MNKGNRPTKEDLTSIFAKNLTFYMEEKDINRTELAKLMGVSHVVAAEWARGVKYPRIDKRQKLAEIFGVSISDLIADRRQRDELMEIREKLRNKPELRVLFDLSDKATSRDLRVAIRALETLTSDK